jgi:hypothetical protein
VDPPKRSATTETITNASRRSAGAASTPTPTPPAIGLCAVEGCTGIGRHIAQRLVADGEALMDVPAALSARARVFATGQGRKTDAVDARSAAVVALRTLALRRIQADDTTVALRLLVDRRDHSAPRAPNSSPGCTTYCSNSSAPRSTCLGSRAATQPATVRPRGRGR